MFEVLYSEKSMKYLEKLGRKEAEIIYRKIESIKDNPVRYLDMLVGIGLCKLRIGDYRAIIRLDRAKNQLVVVDVGHRRAVYKRL